MPTRTDGTALIDLDPWLQPHEGALRDRYNHYRAVAARCLNQYIDCGSLKIGKLIVKRKQIAIVDRDRRASIPFRQIGCVYEYRPTASSGNPCQLFLALCRQLIERQLLI